MLQNSICSLYKTELEIHSALYGDYLQTTSVLARCAQDQCYRGFCRKQQECKSFLQIKLNGCVRMAQISNRNVLSNVEIEIASTRC